MYIPLDVTDIDHACFTSSYRELEGCDCLAKVADQEGLVKLAQDIRQSSLL